ncbi:MAG: metallophosphoesterase, partial [Desulfobulbaceae bacterium]|nr:metallophosphoesterase [Desulfobulbaceae bacterium]
MRIIAFGDIHMDLAKIVDIPALESADLLLLTGDLTNFGGRTDAKRILTAIRAINPNILALAGNLDQPEVNSYLQAEDISLHGHGIMLNDLGIFGVGGSNQTPFATPNEFSENEIASLLGRGYTKVSAAKHHILVSHAPPFDTTADRLRKNTHA